MPDLDLESVKRSVDFVEYARSMGYQEKPGDAVPGITVLEHERLRDRIAVARLAGGGIYARIPDYTTRAPGEPGELARQRLRDCITRSSDAGSIVEFVQSNQRRAGRPEPDLERVCEHLTAWQSIARGLPRGAQHPAGPNVLNKRIGDWGPSPPSHDPPAVSEVQARLQRWKDAQSVIDRKLARGSELAAPSVSKSPSRAADRSARSELGLRRYDWSPAPQSHPASHLGSTRRGRGGPEHGR
jgi:hypothetical protein